MSWILKHKEKTIVFLLLFLIMAVSVIISINLNLNPVFLIMIYALLLLGICLNEVAINKMWRMHKPFQTFSQVRNVDYLVIGDQCNPHDFIPEGKTYVQISAPGRNLNSAYQILRHTHSILKEDGGTVILPCGNSKQNFMIFDIPFLHPVTIKEYHLEGLKMISKVPIVFAPINTIRFILGGGYQTFLHGYVRC